MSDANETVVYIDTFQEEVGEEVAKLLGSVITRYRQTGAALDGATLLKLRAAVREHLQQIPSVLSEVLGQKNLAASGASDAETLRKRWPGLNVRIR